MKSDDMTTKFKAGDAAARTPPDPLNHGTSEVTANMLSMPLSNEGFLLGVAALVDALWRLREERDGYPLSLEAQPQQGKPCDTFLSLVDSFADLVVLSDEHGLGKIPFCDQNGSTAVLMLRYERLCKQLGRDPQNPFPEMERAETPTTGPTSTNPTAKNEQLDQDALNLAPQTLPKRNGRRTNRGAKAKG